MLEENLIQIAGVIDAAEAEMLQQCGIRYLGFPLRVPVHREDLTEEKAAVIFKSLAPPVFGVLITYLSQASEIAAFCHALAARIVQLHGDIGRDELIRLKTLDPNLTVIKSLVVGMGDDKALEAMVPELSPFVDAFITDTFDAKTAASGATGKTHDWRVSRRLVGTCRSTGDSRRRTHAGKRQERDSGSAAGRSRLPHRRRRRQRPQKP
jgi:phosphoribosylanthranilate isomerase